MRTHRMASALIGLGPGDPKEGLDMIGMMLAGAVLGGLAVWHWRNDIQGYVDRLEKNGAGLRTKAADTLQAVQETAEVVLDRTKERVVSGLESGRAAIRPSVDVSRP